MVEVEVDIDHAHTGRRLAGFRHRGRQGRDIARALWPRLTHRRTRIGLIVGLALLVVLGSLVTTPGTDVGRPLAADVDQVVIFGVPGLGIDEVDGLPQLDRLADEGALAATNVRTGGDVPRPWAAYATLSAGVRADAVERAAEAVGGEGKPVDVPYMAETRANAGRYLTSDPGALGTSLGVGGRSTAVVTPGRLAEAGADAGATGAALAVANTGGPGRRRRARPDPPRRGRRRRGRRGGARPARRGRRGGGGPGADRPGRRPARAPRRRTSPESEAALLATDAVIGSVADALPEGTLLLVVGVTPPDDEWALTATVAWGAGVDAHRLSSPTARRPDLVTLTDIGPTVLESLGIDRPPGMAGQALRLRDGTVDRSRLQALDEVARGREAEYFRMTITFIAALVLLQLVGWALLVRGRIGVRGSGVIRFLALTGAAWPLATYLVRLVPASMTLGGVTHVVPWVVAAVVAADRLPAEGPRPGPPGRGLRGHRRPHRRRPGHGRSAPGGERARHRAPHHLPLQRPGQRRLRGAGRDGPARGGHPRRRRPPAAARPWSPGERSWPWWWPPTWPRGWEPTWAASSPSCPSSGSPSSPCPGVGCGSGPSCSPPSSPSSGSRSSSGLDLIRPAEAQTHLARFVNETVADGDLGAAVGRRWAANTRMFTQSAWTWLVLPLALGLAAAVARSRWLRERAPLGPSTHIAVLGTLAAGVLGWLLNDSGVVVTAMVLIYVPVVLLVAAMEPVRGGRTPVPPPRPDGASTEASWPR